MEFRESRFNRGRRLLQRDTSVRYALTLNFVDHLASDICQSEVSTGVTVGQAFVVQTQQVQDCGMQVMDMDAVVDRLKSRNRSVSP